MHVFLLENKFIELRYSLVLFQNDRCTKYFLYIILAESDACVLIKIK